MSELVIKAPAKINLTLEVLGKRPDGFHEIRSVIQTVSLFDILRFSKCDAVEITSLTGGFSAEKSLISKTVDLVKEKSGYSGGVKIEVEKHIPLMSGLGGDSSDAAAVLQGLNQLWNLDWDKVKLSHLAARLGSDVSFFLSGGTALMEGRGEKIIPLKKLPSYAVLLINPPVDRQPGKTARVYAALKPTYFTDGSFTQMFIRELDSRNQILPYLFNTFENILFNKGSELEVYRDHLIKMGVQNVHVAGSGPVLYSLVADEQKAKELLTVIKAQRMEAYLVSTI